MKKRVGKTIIWLMIFLLVFQLANALGIRPARTTVLHDDGLLHSSTLWIVNNDKLDLKVKISAEGELKDYITILTPEMILSNEDSKPVGFIIDLPEDLSPGEHISYIVIDQQPDNIVNTIGSKVILKHRLTVQGPYPDKYVEGKLYFNEQDKIVELISEVKNLGRKNIEKISTLFYFYDKDGKKHSLKTKEASLERKELKTLRTRFDVDLLGRGEYDVSSTTYYDGHELEMSKQLLIGQRKIDIISFNKYFAAEKVNGYDAVLYNDWNTKAKNVYMDVSIKKDNNIIKQFNTKSVNIGTEFVEHITGYFDAKDIEMGKYILDITTFSSNKEAGKESFEVEFLSEEDFDKVSNERLDLNSLTGRVVEKSLGEYDDAVVIFIFGLFILVLIGLYFVYLHTRRKK